MMGYVKGYDCAIIHVSPSLINLPASHTSEHICTQVNTIFLTLLLFSPICAYKSQ